jgi:manganese/iron transport system substrate-binding protein
MIDQTRRMILTAATALAAFALAPGAASAQEKFKAVTTFTVIADMARNVAGDTATVESITKPGAEIHDYQPTPLDVVKAQSADLVLWNGLNLERWFEKFFENVKTCPCAVVSDGIAPMGIKEGPYEGKPNPHAWMSTSSALIYVENIRKALSRPIRPMPRPTRQMPKPTNDQIRAADAPLRARLDKVAQTSAGSSPAKAPSAISPATMAGAKPISGRSTPTSRARRSRCARLIDLVRKNKIPAVFSESTISDKPAQAGRARNRRKIWRCALCRLASRRERAGADLSRSCCEVTSKRSPRAFRQ